MAATRLWAPHTFMFLACSLKVKWGTTRWDSTRYNHTVSVAMYREFSRVKSWNICHRFHRHGHLLLLGGDLEFNPDDKWKFPCGICTKPAKNNQKGIQCDECSIWFHVNSKCCNISAELYNILANSSCTWFCPQYGLPNISDSLFFKFN